MFTINNFIITFLLSHQFLKLKGGAIFDNIVYVYAMINMSSTRVNFDAK